MREELCSDNLKLLLHNLHSDTLQTLDLSDVFTLDPMRSAHDGEGNDATHEQLEEVRRVAIVVAAFIRSCVQSRIVRFVLGQPSVEQNMIRLDKAAGPPTRGCSGLDVVKLECTSLCTGGIDLIEASWRLALQGFDDHPNSLFQHVFPRYCMARTDKNFDLQSMPPSSAELVQVFQMAAEISGAGHYEDEYGPDFQEAFSDPTIQCLMRKEPGEEDVAAFSALLDISNLSEDPYRFEFGRNFWHADDDCIRSQKLGRRLRSSAFRLLTAARVLACQVRPGSTGVCGWLLIPVDIRRSCLEYLQFFPPAEVPRNADSGDSDENKDIPDSDDGHLDGSGGHETEDGSDNYESADAAHGTGVEPSMNEAAGESEAAGTSGNYSGGHDVNEDDFGHNELNECSEQPIGDTSPAQGGHVLSSKMVNRIFSYAADRRTIGYGLLPEATFLDLRIASDTSSHDTEHLATRVLDEAPWSFASARRRWRPVDFRLDEKYSELIYEMPRSAECFIRAIGLMEESVEMGPVKHTA